ncbi:phage head morphogenesis protein, SPP1 gp7 family [Klebsiella variicola]|uniref:Phage head morphogenesis protein, SPP1 gp7 family n=1 Tax=Klebsiella variicola TaxID=244366 RepID=A0A7H4MP98_KLEVA|nr:phage head morphogenesis protein, SPP1 gp7 family [Klebsiella variicola]
MVRSHTDAVACRVNSRETASVISKRLDVSMSKAKTIAQTEQVGALWQTQWNETDWAGDRLGLNIGLMWLSALKPTTRSWHASRHGKVYTTEQVRTSVQRTATVITAIAARLRC